MKTNGDMLHGGKLKPESRQAWANYYAKFIKAYEREGIPIWGITVQNEPMATQTWESCIYTAEDERDFIKNFLGPTMRREGLADRKIIAWDHNRDLIYQRVSTILADPEAARYVWGFGFHWYEPWSGGTMLFDNVRLVRETFPEKKLLFTEGTVDSFKAEDIHNWRLGEYYGRSMINDFNDGAVGWADWNVLLDERGGPNHVGNYCFAPVHADTKTGELIYTNSYYYIGHFSKFVRPGARRIASSPSRRRSCPRVHQRRRTSRGGGDEPDRQARDVPPVDRGQCGGSQQLAAFDPDSRLLACAHPESRPAGVRGRLRIANASVIDCERTNVRLLARLLSRVRVRESGLLRSLHADDSRRNHSRVRHQVGNEFGFDRFWIARLVGQDLGDEFRRRPADREVHAACDKRGNVLLPDPRRRREAERSAPRASVLGS
jgi:hypothetical protein